jgi:hypothetical protein
MYFVTHHLAKHLVLGCGAAVYNGTPSEYAGNKTFNIKIIYGNKVKRVIKTFMILKYILFWNST